MTSRLLLSRRKFLTASAIGAGSLALAACDNLSEPGSGFRGVLDRTDELTEAVQRLLLGDQRLAHEFAEADISRYFRANGNTEVRDPVYNQLAAGPEPLLRCVAAALGHVGSPNLKGFNESLVIFAGEHAEILRASGWSRRDVQQFLLEHTRLRLADVKRAARLPGEVNASDETTWRYVFEDPEDILIVCAGGRAGSWSACLPGWGKKWTRSVTEHIEDRRMP